VNDLEWVAERVGAVHERPKTFSRGVIIRPRASRSTSNSAPAMRRDRLCFRM
jgi:hypothetical protein